VSGIHVRVRVAREEYALPVERVLEVAEFGDLTPVPGSPPEIIGVCNLRGQVIPVMALASMLGLAEQEQEPERIVVAELGDRRAGLAVDSVVDVGELPDASEQVSSPYLTGAVLIDGVLVGILDADAILGSDSAPETPA
jgi:purine-binding chemotaxis protein CheW